MRQNTENWKGDPVHNLVMMSQFLLSFIHYQVTSESKQKVYREMRTQKAFELTAEKFSDF